MEMVKKKYDVTTVKQLCLVILKMASGNAIFGPHQ